MTGEKCDWSNFTEKQSKEWNYCALFLPNSVKYIPLEYLHFNNKGLLMPQNFWKKRDCLDYFVASSLDRIKMTKNWLEFERKILTTTNLFFELDRNSWHELTLTLPPKNMLFQLAWIVLYLSGLNISGTEVRRTPDVKLLFVGFIKFVGFNFGHVQLLSFVVVMVWSYSFGRLDSAKWITLIITPAKKLSGSLFFNCRNNQKYKNK